MLRARHNNMGGAMFFERNVVTEQVVDTAILAFPNEERAGSEDGLSDNHAYVDMRGVSANEAKEAVDEEHDLLLRILDIGDEDQDSGIEEIEDLLREEMNPLASFDLGVGGLVLALSSLGCVPISSCNGGVVGGSHSLPHPWIIFHAPLAVIDQLIVAAKAANVGLLNNDGGMLELFSGNVFSFNEMARDLISHG